MHETVLGPSFRQGITYGKSLFGMLGAPKLVHMPHTGSPIGALKTIEFRIDLISALGPGCVKTRLSQGRSELFSQLPSASSTFQCDWFARRRNRGGNSMRKFASEFSQSQGQKATLPIDPT
jgi:hypothetical protein